MDQRKATSATDVHVNLNTARPLAVSTWIHGDPSFLKVRELIEVIDPTLTVTDRKMLDAMLAHSSEIVLNDALHGTTQPGTRLYSALATDIKRAMGWESHSSNTELLRTAQRIQGAIITIGYFATDEDQLRHMNMSLVTFSDVPEGQGLVYWRFSAELERLMRAHGERILVQLKVLAKLTSGYSHRLYQLLCANIDRSSFAWTVAVEDLRKVLNATAASYDSWAILERRVLKVAVGEINCYAPFRVHYTLAADPRTRRRTHVTFHVDGPNSALPPPETSLRPRVQLSLPLDLAPMPPRPGEPPQTLNRRINVPTRERMRQQFGNAPIDALIDRWATWCMVHAIKIDRPARVFERWLTTMFGDLVLVHRRNETPDWTSALVRVLDTPLHRAMYALSTMAIQQRQRWLSIARRQAVEKDTRAKLPVPDADPVYFHLWTHLIVDQLAHAHPI